MKVFKIDPGRDMEKIQKASLLTGVCRVRSSVFAGNTSGTEGVAQPEALDYRAAAWYCTSQVTIAGSRFSMDAFRNII